MPSAVESFDPASPTMAADRYAVLAALRSESPVVFVPALQMWAVTGHDTVREVLADPRRFRSGGTYLPSQHLPAASFAEYPADGPLWRNSMVSADDEQHRRLRTAMTRAFTMRQVRTLEPDILADAKTLTADLIADLIADGPDVDLFSTFVRPLPSRTIARFFGLPVQEAPRFSSWSDAFLVPQVPGLPEVAYVAAARQYAEFDDYVRSLVTADLSDVGPGILHDLVSGHRDGTHDLTEDELVGDIANVLFAGHETTVSTLSNVLVRLLKDRPLWTALAAGEIDLPPLVDELLRLDTSGVGLFRRTAEPTTLAGVHLPADARLWVSFAAADRDPTAFDDPDHLHISRPRAAETMTFGYGVHRCIGTALAKTQVRIVLQVLPRMAPGLHLTGPVQEVPNFIIRTTPGLPVAL